MQITSRGFWADKIIKEEKYSEHCEIFKIERFAKGTMPVCRCATSKFSEAGVEGFVKLGHSSSKTQEKEVPQRCIFEIFLPDTLKTTF